MHKVPADKAATAEALKFFGFAFDKGGKMAEELDYVPMPANVIEADPEDLERRRQGDVIRPPGEGSSLPFPGSVCPGHLQR